MFSGLVERGKYNTLRWFEHMKRMLDGDFTIRRSIVEKLGVKERLPAR